MSDIVERLRLRPQREMLYLDGCIAAGYGPTVESQAADEIESLRSRLAETEQERDVLQDSLAGSLGTTDKLAARLAEAEALLDEALRLLSVMPGHGLSAFESDDWWNARATWLAARRS